MCVRVCVCVCVCRGGGRKGKIPYYSNHALKTPLCDVYTPRHVGISNPDARERFFSFAPYSVTYFSRSKEPRIVQLVRKY